MNPPSLFRSFSRSQVSSFLATLIDFGLLFTLVEIFHVWYVIATATGAFAGGVSNFLLNRFWSFRAHHSRWSGQALRYSVTSGSSLALNTSGVYLFTEYGKLHYSLSVLLVSAVVGVLFNFPMQRHYVFRRRKDVEKENTDPHSGP